MNEYERALLNVLQQYPRLQQSQWGIVDRTLGNHHGQLEFRHPDEPDNPYPGVPTVEVYNPNLKGKWLEQAIFGDMLHYMPEADKNFNAMRQDFFGLLTPEQNILNRKTYHDAKSPKLMGHKNNWYYGENRPYDKWFDLSRGDAWIRGILAPDERNDWAGAYTEPQIRQAEKMEKYLRSK